jgi:hypothetical protein
VPSVEQNTENIKTGVISGAEYRKHENWCHQWSRVPKTWKLVSSVEQIAENMKIGAIGGACLAEKQLIPILWSVVWSDRGYNPRSTVLCSTDDTTFYVFGTLLHWWHQFSCFRYSAPLMTPNHSLTITFQQLAHSLMLKPTHFLYNSFLICWFICL